MKNKLFIFILSVIVAIFVIYKIIFVQFADANMGRLISATLGKNRFFVTRAELNKIERISIGPTCNYKTIDDLAKLKNLKMLTIGGLNYKLNQYSFVCDVLGFTTRKYDGMCDEGDRASEIERDLADIFQKCKQLEVFEVVGVNVSDWRYVEGYNNERTFIQFNDISFLTYANNLKELSLPYQEHIEDYSCIFSLNTLETLSLHDSNISGNIDLRLCENLQSLIISNTNISSIEFNEDTLDWICISPNQEALFSQYGEKIDLNVWVYDSNKYINSLCSGYIQKSKLLVNMPKEGVVLSKDSSVKLLEDKVQDIEGMYVIGDEEGAVFDFFTGRYKNKVEFVCLKSQNNILACYISEPTDASIMGISVGDGIEKVAQVLGKTDGYGRYDIQGVLYEFEDAKMIIYFDGMGLHVKSIEVYFDDSVFAYNEITDSEAEYKVITY